MNWLFNIVLYKPRTYSVCLFQVVLLFNFFLLSNNAYASSQEKKYTDYEITIDDISIYSSEANSDNFFPEDNAFTPYDSNVLVKGKCWIKLDINNSGFYTKNIFLQFPWQVLAIKSFQIIESGDTLRQLAGRNISPKQKSHILGSANVIEVEVTGKTGSSVYIHITPAAGSSLSLQPAIVQYSTFNNRVDSAQNIALIFTSIFIILGLYNFILHFILNERGFLFYSLMVLGFALHAALPLLFEIFKVPITQTLSIFSASFIIFSGAHFSIHFLKARHDLIWNKLLRILASLNLVLAILLIGNLIVGGEIIFNRIAALIAAISALALVILWTGTATSVWKTKDIRGKYFLLINVPILLSALIFTLAWLGARYQFIPPSFTTATILNIIFYSGAVIQLVAFSLVFGYHIRGLEYEKLEIQRKLNRQLEEKVEERTNNLKSASEKIVEQKDALIKLNDLKDKLFTIISHDLRSPLTSLQGMLELFKSNTLSEAEARGLVGKIDNTLSHTTSVMDNLLHWSKSQMTGIQLKKSEFGIDQLINKNLDLIQPLTEDKKIKIKKVLLPHKVYADENMINIVIRNLLSNAIKFTHVKGNIDINMNLEGHFIQVSIVDDGVGMSEEEVSRLFQVKNHHSSAGTLNEKGTGLGLILSQEFIKRNGGHINVRSKLNVGTTFTFSLPLPDQPQ